MKKIIRYKCKTNSDYEIFRQEYKNQAGAPLDLAYLQRGTGVYFRRETGEWLGGYILNTKPPFRYDETLPAGISAMDCLPNGEKNNIIEACALHVNRKILTPRERRFILYSMWRDTLRSKKRWIFGGTLVEKIGNVYGQAGEKVYEGPTLFDEGQTAYIYAFRAFPNIFIVVTLSGLGYYLRSIFNAHGK